MTSPMPKLLPLILLLAFPALAADAPAPTRTYTPGGRVANCNVKCPTQWRLRYETLEQPGIRHEVLLPTTGLCVPLTLAYDYAPPGATYWLDLRDGTGTGKCGPRDWSPAWGPYIVSYQVINGQPVPEPSAGLLLVAGVGGLAALERFKKWKR